MTLAFTHSDLHAHPQVTHTATVTVHPSPRPTAWDSHDTAAQVHISPVFVVGFFIGLFVGVFVGKRLQRRETTTTIKELLSGGGKHE